MRKGKRQKKAIQSNPKPRAWVSAPPTKIMRAAARGLRLARIAPYQLPVGREPVKFRTAPVALAREAAARGAQRVQARVVQRFVLIAARGRYQVHFLAAERVLPHFVGRVASGQRLQFSNFGLDAGRALGPRLAGRVAALKSQEGQAAQQRPAEKSMYAHNPRSKKCVRGTGSR